MKQNNNDYQGIMPYTFSLRKQNLSLSMEKKVGGKLLDCLKKLTKKEMKQFVLYVNSPFFNKNEILVKLCNILQTFHPNFDVLLEKELFTSIFEHQDFNYSKLRNLLSDLNKLFKSFLAIAAFQKEKDMMNMYYIEQLNEKRLQTHFTKDVDAFEKRLKNRFYQTEKDFFIKFRLSEIKYQNAILDRKRDTPNALQQLMNDADKHYLYVKLRYLFAALNEQNLQNIQYNFWLFNPLTAVLEQKNNDYFEEAPILKVYYYFILLLKEMDNENYFLLAKNSLFHIEPHLSMSEQRHFYIVLTNCCYWANNKPKQKKAKTTNYLQEAFDLYQKGLEKQVWYTNGKLSPHHFRNIVKVALKNEKFEWVEHFIATNKANIEEKYASIIVVLSMSNLFFFQKKFQEASAELTQIEIENYEFIDSHDNIAYRILAIKTYYEIQEQNNIYTDFIFDKVEALRIYLLRNTRISKSVKERHQNFVNICKRLIHVQRNSQSLKRLESDIANTSPLAEREWLIEKINLLN